MTEPKFLQLISDQTLLADGAMGTMLHARGVGFDKCFDELNLTNLSYPNGKIPLSIERDSIVLSVMKTVKDMASK